MNLKNLVKISISTFIFLVVTILLLGLTDSKALPYMYFIFIFPFLIILFFTFNKTLKANALLIIMLALFISISLTSFVDSVKIYSDKSQEVIKANQDIVNQINELSSQNDYYEKYITYLKGEISISQSNSQSLQQQINSLISQPAQQPPINLPPVYQDDEDEEDD